MYWIEIISNIENWVEKHTSSFKEFFRYSLCSNKIFIASLETILSMVVTIVCKCVRSLILSYAI